MLINVAAELGPLDCPTRSALVYLCDGLQKTSWSMVQTSLVSSGNCVASPISYSSSCCVTQFLIAQKGSLNDYFFQFSLKTCDIPGLLDVNW